MQVRLIPAAQREYSEAARYYVLNASKAVAEQLTQDLLEAAGLVSAFPQGFRDKGQGIRYCPLRRFPYQLVYVIHQERAVVVAFMHQKRRPKYWTKRIV